MIGQEGLDGLIESIRQWLACFNLRDTSREVEFRVARVTVHTVAAWSGCVFLQVFTWVCNKDRGGAASLDKLVKLVKQQNACQRLVLVYICHGDCAQGFKCLKHLNLKVSTSMMNQVDVMWLLLLLMCRIGNHKSLCDGHKLSLLGLHLASSIRGVCESSGHTQA